MATAAKKPASKTVTSSANKPAAPAKAATKAAPAKAVAKPAAKPVKAVAVKPSPAKAAPAKAAKPAAAPLKKDAKKPVTSTKTPAAKPAPASKAAAPKPVAKPAAAPAKAAVKKAAPAPAKPAPQAKPAASSPPVKAMKATETKVTASKPAKAAPKKAPGNLLSETDVLAMSDKDYMNEAQLAFFKAKLEAMRDEILENARETGEHLKENEVFADPNDRATVEEENLLEQRVRDRERKLLKKINASLARIEEGAYGYCLETGDPIGIPRLLARPTAELSIEAQEKHERLEKLYAD